MGHYTSFDRVYAEYAGMVQRTLRRAGVRDDMVDDAAQDVFVVWWRRCGDFRGDARVSTYLFEVARRVSANYRRQTRRTDAQALGTEDFELADTHPLDLADALDMAGHHIALEREVARLPPKLRTVYRMCEYGEQSAREVGAELGVSPNTVSSRLRLGRKRIVRALGGKMHRGFVAFGWGWPFVPVGGGALVIAAAMQWSAPQPFIPLAVEQPTLSEVERRNVQQTALQRAPVVCEPHARGDVQATQPRHNAQATRVSQPPNAQPRRALRRQPSQARKPSSPDSLAVEAALLSQASRALRHGRPLRAVDILERGAAQLEQGTLKSEWMGLLAAAYCHAGDIARGKAVARRLRAAVPGASALAIATAACSDPGVDGRVKTTRDVTN